MLTPYSMRMFVLAPFWTKVIIFGFHWKPNMIIFVQKRFHDWIFWKFKKVKITKYLMSKRLLYYLD